MMKRIVEKGLLFLLALSVLCMPVAFAEELEMSNWVLIDGLWFYVDVDGMMYDYDPYGLTLPPEGDEFLQFEPAPAPKPTSKPKPKRTPKPEPEIVNEPEPEIVYEPEPEIVYEPEPEVDYVAELQAMYPSEPEAAPEPEPETVREPEPPVDYVAELQAIHPSEPEAANQQEPEDVYQSAPEPAYEPEPEMANESEPAPAYESDPEVVYQSEPEPQPQPEAEPVPELVPEVPAEPLSVAIFASYGGGEPRVGDNVRLESVVEGAQYGESLRYQWQFRAPGGEWTDIAGANSDVYSYEADEVNAGYVWRLIVTRQ